jgi:hypothetical protein
MSSCNDQLRFLETPASTANISSARKVTNAGSSKAPSRRSERRVPQLWAKSELTQFFELLEEQSIATFAGMPHWFDALERIDNSLAVNGPEMFHEIDEDRRAAALLFIRCFSDWRRVSEFRFRARTFPLNVTVATIAKSLPLKRVPVVRLIATQVYMCEPVDSHPPLSS